jgi:hypothetical protein
MWALLEDLRPIVFLAVRERDERAGRFDTEI